MDTVRRRAAILIAALALAWASPIAAQAPRPISIGLSSPSFGTLAARLAQDLGLFEKHGIKPNIIVMESGNASATALISRSVEAVLSGPGDLVLTNARGQKVVLIANTYGGFGATLILSKRTIDAAGVPTTAPVADRLKPLDGLTIAAPSATSSYTVAFRQAAASVGANVRFTYMGFPAMVAALESGAIQGYIAGAPYWATSVTRGSGFVWLSGPKGDLPRQFTPVSSGSLQAMRDFADANPDLMTGLQAVFDDLARTIERDPEAVKARITRFYPDLDAANLDLLFASEASAWMAKPLTPDDMRREIGFIQATSTNPALMENLDPAALLFRR